MRNDIGRLFLAAGTAATLIAMPLATRASTTNAPTVIISEIGWAGSSLSTVDEWLELTNLTDAAVDLSGWTLTGAATSNGTLAIPGGAAVAPHSTFLISNYDKSNAKSSLARAPDFVTASVSLSNSAQSLGLVDANGTVRDVAGSGSAPLAGRTGGGAESPGTGPASMVRLAPVADGTLAASWLTATESTGFDDGALELGTPGAVEGWFVESVDEPVVESVSSTDISPTVSLPVGQEEPGVVVSSDPITDPVIEADPPIEETVESPVVEQIAETSVTPSENSSTTVVDEVPIETKPAEIISEKIGSTVEEIIPDPIETIAEESVPDLEPEPARQIIEETTVDPIPVVEIEAVSITASSVPPGTLLLNELVSDAADEWIEILNPYNNVIDLSGWIVRDATKKATALPSHLLGLGQFVVVTNPAGKLNNDGDTLELVDPSGSVVDSVTYGNGGEPIAKKPDALARDSDGAWTVTSIPTPGTENLFDVIAEPVSPLVSPPPSEEGSGVVTETVIETIVAAPETVVAESVVAETTGDPNEPAVARPTTLRLTQVYPNATGDDASEEFIAITNVGTETVDLAGWTVADASGKAYSPSDPTPIEPGATLTLLRATTKIVLNNTSDAVTLSAPDGTPIDSISYDAPKIGSVLRLQGSDWVWSGDASGTKPGAVSTSVASAPAAAVAAAPASRVSAGRSSVTGTVLVKPGVLGSQIFYVDDGDGGIQVYKNDAEFPDLQEGDVVTVSGTITESRGEERLKVGKTGSISVVDSTEPEAAELVSIADVDAADHGKLLRVSGIVLLRTGSRITLEDHGAQIAVRIADGTGIDATTFARGSTVDVTGILVAAGGTLTLLPRSPDDVIVSLPAAIETSVAATSGKAAQSAGDKTTATVVTLGTVLSLGLYAGRKLIPSWNAYAKTRALRLAASAAR